MQEAFYRKYRPSSLEELVGQSDAVQLISEQIKNNNLSGIGMMIKRCRGSMAKFLITKKVNNLDGIKRFSEFGFNFYSYDESLSKFTFVKNDK